jgi:hypothetical protein
VLEQMRDVPAQIVGARVVPFRAVEGVDQRPGGLGGGAGGGLAAVFGAQRRASTGRRERVGVHRGG